MKLSDLAETPFSPDPDIAGITPDSRAVKPGFLFAALPGTKVDGARFVPAAEEAGAAAVLAAPGVAAKVPLITDENPRRRLALLSARFHGAQPETVAGITGTNGKTSTARFAQQIWTALGRRAGSLGTLGAVAPGYDHPLRHTTPDPTELHAVLAEMVEAGATHLAMEVSSHGLAQHRADGVRFRAAGFTNITQDHLDYHPTFADYFAAKTRLFAELLAEDGVAVLNADGEGAGEMADAARARGRRVMTTGAAGEDVRLLSAEPHAEGLAVEVAVGAVRKRIDLALVGAFQAENVLLAAGLAIACGEDAEAVLSVLGGLSGAPGRMQRVATARGAGVYVDYAHTPDAVETALAALRPHAEGRLHVVLGAGGDRDRGKRPLMGAAAARGADVVVVTDDNPRTEAPAPIRAAILEGAQAAGGAAVREIGDRRAAIVEAMAALSPGDALLIAGKGHETGQIVGDRVLPFDDGETAKAAAAELEENAR